MLRSPPRQHALDVSKPLPSFPTWYCFHLAALIKGRLHYITVCLTLVQTFLGRPPFDIRLHARPLNSLDSDQACRRAAQSRGRRERPASLGALE